MKSAFSQFFSQDIVNLLNKYGVETVVERGGRIFPASNNSADVLKALLRWNKQNGVEIRCNCPVTDIIVTDNVVSGVVLVAQGRKREIKAGNVILSLGGNSYPATGSDGSGYKLARSVGHKIEAVRPSLVPLETEGDMAERLQGLSLRNSKAVVWVNRKKHKEDFGELLFTHFGLSGPIILTLSRFVVDELRKKNDIEISIDLKPALDEQKLDKRLLRDLDEFGKKRIDNIIRKWLPAKLIPVFIEAVKLNPSKLGHQISAKERRKIRILLKDLRFKVTGHRPFKEAIITAGGVSTKEIDSKTMESKLVKNLHFAGELIDLDADTGGYNLQIAYSTGWLAGQSCVRKSC